jgi:hypothetical protein
MTAWLLLVCVGVFPAHGNPPPVGEQIPDKKQPQVIPIPTGILGPENSILVEWTTVGPTIRFARRDADDVVTEAAIGKRVEVRTASVARESDSTRTWVVRSATDRTVGVRMKVYLGDRWDGRLEIESSQAGGARVSTQLTYWRFDGVEYAVGFDTARGFVVRHGYHYDDDDLALWSLGCYLRCLPWVEQVTASREEFAAFIKRRR